MAGIFSDKLGGHFSANSGSIRSNRCYPAQSKAGFCGQRPSFSCESTRWNAPCPAAWREPSSLCKSA